MRRLRVDEALWVLEVYNCIHDDICFRDTWTTPYALGVVVDADRIACGLGIKFWGGVPGNRAIYTGDLSMLVTDRVLQAWIEKEIGWAWLLRFNTETMTHIKIQLESCMPYKQQMLFDITEKPPWRAAHENIQIGNHVFPMHGAEQWNIIKQNGDTVPIRIPSDVATDDGRIRLWSSSGQTRVCGGVC
jgi:hypothetical protein